VQATSIEAYHNLPDKEAQMEIIEKIMMDSKHIADFEIQEEYFKRTNQHIDKSTISARRNDIRIKHIGRYGHSIFLNKGTTLLNPKTGKRCIVWEC
jgi:hypothetical protein